MRFNTSRTLIGSMALIVIGTGCASTTTQTATTSADVSRAADRGAATPSARSLEGMVRIPLTVTAQGSALVNCEVNGKTIVLILDTGAQGTVIDLRAATEAGIKSYEVPGFYSKGVGAGRVAMRRGETITLNMSGFPARVTPSLQDFSGLTLMHLQTGKTPIVGLLGFDVLRSYGAFIDLQEGAMYLRPRP